MVTFRFGTLMYATRITSSALLIIMGIRTLV